MMITPPTGGRGERKEERCENRRDTRRIYGTHRHNLRNASSSRSCDESLGDDHPSDLMCCVHYDDLVADNCYYPDWVDGAMTNPNTDDSGDSLQPLPAWQIFNYPSFRKKNTSSDVTKSTSPFEKCKVISLAFNLVIRSGWDWILMALANEANA